VQCLAAWVGTVLVLHGAVPVRVSWRSDAGEVTSHVVGRLVTSCDALEGTPGTFCFEADEKGLFYECPCGCGSQGFLGFRGRTKPSRPSWIWNGNREQPTLTPSIRRLSGCKWHGHLVHGAWTPCGDSGQ
jgi:hypothetical protein